MIFKIFKDSRDLANDKLRNPFFGTYIFILLYRNWDLVYSLFYFPSTLDSKGRIDHITEYFKNKSYLDELGSTLFYTFCILLASVVLLLITHAIMRFSENKIKPLIDKGIDSKTTVTRDKYNKVKYQRDELQDSMDKLRITSSEQNKEIREREEHIKGLISEISKKGRLEIKKNDEITVNHKQINDLKQHISIENEKTNKLKDIAKLHLQYIFNSSEKQLLVKFSNFYDINLNNVNLDLTTKSFPEFDTKFSNYLENFRLIVRVSGINKYEFTDIGHVLRDSIIFSDNNRKSINFDANRGISLYLKEVVVTKL